MKTTWATSYGLCAVVILLAGCGGFQNISRSALPPAMNGNLRLEKRSGSWMKPGTSSEDLIYATGGCGGTCVLSYPEGKLVGELDVGDDGICSDSDGNVFIPNQSSLLEYHHGATKPTGKLSVSSGTIISCSLDAQSGNVAVSVLGDSSYNVAVFPSGSGNPTTYQISFDIEYPGYDNQGNLFVDGYGKSGEFGLYELPTGGSTFTEISLNPLPHIRPGQVQWDGNYITVEGFGFVHGVTVYRLDVSSSSGTVAGTTTFEGVTRNALQSWIYGKNIFIPFGSQGSGSAKRKIGVWNYPAGGKAVHILRKFVKTPDLQAVTFSPAST